MHLQLDKYRGEQISAYLLVSAACLLTFSIINNYIHRHLRENDPNQVDFVDVCGRKRDENRMKTACLFVLVICFDSFKQKTSFS